MSPHSDLAAASIFSGGATGPSSLRRLTTPRWPSPHSLLSAAPCSRPLAQSRTALSLTPHAQATGGEQLECTQARLRSRLVHCLPCPEPQLCWSWAPHPSPCASPVPQLLPRGLKPDQLKALGRMTTTSSHWPRRPHELTLQDLLRSPLLSGLVAVLGAARH